MTEEKQQKFTAKVRRGLVWVDSVASAELAKKKAEATGVRIEGALIDCDEAGRATAIELIRVDL